MELKDLIYRRKSVRKYTAEPVSQETVEEIQRFCSEVTPLVPDIGVKAMVVDRSQVRFFLPWKTPQLIAVFSEEKPGYLENVGFVFQQVELYLQSIGLGACWLGLGKFKRSELPQVEGMEFVIFIAFGQPDEPQFREDVTQFQRKPLSEITDQDDHRLECARLAPSSTNSQPWYFTHEDGVIHAFCSKAGFLRHTMLGSMNRIDMGIALAHLYLENPDTFRFFATQPANSPTNHSYIGSITL